MILARNVCKVTYGQVCTVFSLLNSVNRGRSQDSHVSRALGNLPWLDSLHRMTVNNPDYHSIELPAALGIGNARSLAQIFNLVHLQSDPLA